jgi:hypothetical protein
MIEKTAIKRLHVAVAGAIAACLSLSTLSATAADFPDDKLSEAAESRFFPVGACPFAATFARAPVLVESTSGRISFHGARTHRDNVSERLACFCTPGLHAQWVSESQAADWADRLIDKRYAKVSIKSTFLQFGELGKEFDYEGLLISQAFGAFSIYHAYYRFIFSSQCITEARVVDDEPSSNRDGIERFLQSVRHLPQATALRARPSVLIEGRWTANDCRISYSELKFLDANRSKAAFSYVDFVDPGRNLDKIPVAVTDVGDTSVNLEFAIPEMSRFVVFRTDDFFESMYIRTKSETQFRC